MKETIMGVDVSLYTYEELQEAALADIRGGKKSFIVAINPEKIMKAQEDPELLTLLNQATYQIPDGIGVILASKLNKGKLKERVTGIDMMLRLCELAANHNLRVFLYGAKPGVAEAAKTKLQEMYQGLNVVGVIDGYEQDEAKIIETINTSKPHILFVALGSPKQEHWITEHMDKLYPSIYQGVGGSYDVICGNIKRAPLAFQRLGLEWLYRLILEPKRIKRQLALPQFLMKAMRRGN